MPVHVCLLSHPDGRVTPLTLDVTNAAQIQGAAFRRALAEADRSRIAEYRAEAEARARGSTHCRTKRLSVSMLLPNRPH